MKSKSRIGQKKNILKINIYLGASRYQPVLLDQGDLSTKLETFCLYNGIASPLKQCQGVHCLIYHFNILTDAEQVIYKLFTYSGFAHLFLASATTLTLSLVSGIC